MSGNSQWERPYKCTARDVARHSVIAHTLLSIKTFTQVRNPPNALNVERLLATSGMGWDGMDGEG